MKMNNDMNEMNVHNDYLQDEKLLNFFKLTLQEPKWRKGRKNINLFNIKNLLNELCQHIFG